MAIDQLEGWGARHNVKDPKGVGIRDQRDLLPTVAVIDIAHSTRVGAAQTHCQQA